MPRLAPCRRAAATACRARSARRPSQARGRRLHRDRARRRRGRSPPYTRWRSRRVPAPSVRSRARGRRPRGARRDRPDGMPRQIVRPPCPRLRRARARSTVRHDSLTTHRCRCRAPAPVERDRGRRGLPAHVRGSSRDSRLEQQHVTTVESIEPCLHQSARCVVTGRRPPTLTIKERHIKHQASTRSSGCHCSPRPRERMRERPVACGRLLTTVTAWARILVH